jgi:hypothetical protein
VDDDDPADARDLDRATEADVYLDEHAADARDRPVDAGRRRRVARVGAAPVRGPGEQLGLFGP